MKKEIKHILIDLDSGEFPEVYLHVFKKELYAASEDINIVKLLVIEEDGYDCQNPKLKIMTREQFIERYKIDVPELF